MERLFGYALGAVLLYGLIGLLWHLRAFRRRKRELSSRASSTPDEWFEI